MRDLARSVFTGIVDDIRQGKDAADTLSDALGTISDKLLSLGTDALFGGSGGGFGLLGQLLGLPGRAAGGPVSAGQPYVVGEKRPEIFVPNTSGRIIPNVPAMPTPAAASGGVVVHYAPTIDARGADTSAVAKLAQVIAQDRANFTANVKAAFKKIKQGQ